MGGFGELLHNFGGETDNFELIFMFHVPLYQAHLVSINSARENALVGKLTSEETWIGGKRVCQGCNEWTWTDGTPWDFENWRKGEPNNGLGRENIVGIDGGDANYGWFDDGAVATETKTFVCSKTLSGMNETI